MTAAGGWPQFDRAPSVAFIDVDGTLLAETTTFLFARILMRRGLIRRSSLLRALYHSLQHRFGRLDFAVANAGLLRQAALAYCQKIATRSRPGIAEMKRLAREGADMATDQQMRLERDAAVRALPSEDVAEGLNAFENRRTPAFKA